MISIIAAIAQNGAIGYRGDLIYHLSADLKRFKLLTTGHTIIMGRKTFESLPKGALPNRRNIVLSKQEGIAFDGAEVYKTIEEALAHCSDDEKVYVIGGAQIYSQAISLAQELEITLIHDTPAQADAYFPDFASNGNWLLTNSEHHEPDDKNPYPYTFCTYTRRS